MNLIYELLNEPVVINPGEICVVAIENTQEFRELLFRVNTNNSKLVYYDKGEEINPKYIENALNLVELDFSDRKIAAMAQKSLESYANNEFNYVNTLEIKSLITQYVENLIFESDIPLGISENVDLQQIFKAVGLEIRDTSESFIEKVINYIDLQLEFKNIKVLVVSNLLLYLDETEQAQLLDYITQQEICIIDIERALLSHLKHDHLKIILFDNDLCRIL